MIKLEPFNRAIRDYEEIEKRNIITNLEASEEYLENLTYIAGKIREYWKNPEEDGAAYIITIMTYRAQEPLQITKEELSKIKKARNSALQGLALINITREFIQKSKLGENVEIKEETLEDIVSTWENFKLPQQMFIYSLVKLQELEQCDRRFLSNLKTINR